MTWQWSGFVHAWLWGRFDLNLSAVPIQYARNCGSTVSCRLVVSLAVFYGDTCTPSWGTAGIREMVLVGLSCLSGCTMRPVGILLFDARMPRSYYVLWFVLMTAANIHVGAQQFSGDAENRKQAEPGDGPGRASRVMIIGEERQGPLLSGEMKGSERSTACLCAL